MTWIEDLLAEHCPDGVAYQELQQIFTTKNGYTPSKADASAWADGTVPWFRMEDLRANGRVLHDSIQHIAESAVKGGRLFPANSILIATSATIGDHALVTVPHLSNQRFTSLTLKPEFQNVLEMKFVFYYCFALGEWCRNNTTVAGFASVDMTGFKRFKFPMPPLPVQREIVAILDATSELHEALVSEVDLRSRQFNYYRELWFNLADSDTECERLPLSELLSYEQPTKYLVASTAYDDSFETPVLTAGQTFVLGYTDEVTGVYPASPADPVIIFDDFTTASKWVDFPFKAKSSAMKMLRAKEGGAADLGYIYFAMLGIDYSPQDHARQWISRYSKFTVPVPSRAVQEEIVKKLDVFLELDAQLKAELADRGQQSEFYRRQLFALKESSNA